VKTTTTIKLRLSLDDDDLLDDDDDPFECACGRIFGGGGKPVDQVVPPTLRDDGQFGDGFTVPGRVRALNSPTNFVKAKPAEYLKDFATKNTTNHGAQLKSEGQARALAREKLGTTPVEVAPNKWRSMDGKWQYRAKPNDVSKNHIHLEELNPKTGEVLQNYHLYWPNGTGR
jgi:hypothetical protein